ncbi:MAG: RsmB/NOP family class I SAM-dependent RNA methyltransferase [Bacteroidetes bacterium]|nr:RsmB/NOP family class I SAM-dependent RNA methyltransferase [Bacteroidota bacterium]
MSSGFPSHHRIAQVKDIIKEYSYSEPFHRYLSEFFRANKHLGSRDRRVLRNLSYHYFRIGRALREESFETRLLISDFLCSQTSIFSVEDLTLHLKGISLSNYVNGITDKLIIVKEEFSLFNTEDIFPCLPQISSEIEKDSFLNSHFSQPYVWIKVEKGKDPMMQSELETAQITIMENPTQGIFGFLHDVKLDSLSSFKKGYFRIQDLHTQLSTESFRPKPNEFWWDCCAGSGGKSLSLLDAEPTLNLYASDVRPSILMNLEERFANHHKKAKSVFKCDLLQPISSTLPMFDGIIIDAPCTGSGTWARNPENLVGFDIETITDFTQKQMDILRNVYNKLKPGKPLIYITCSVFKEENEDIISAFIAETGAKICEQKYLKGYLHHAENIFLCRLEKPLH